MNPTPRPSETELTDRLCSLVAEQNEIIREQAHIITQLAGDNPMGCRIQTVSLEYQQLAGDTREI